MAGPGERQRFRGTDRTATAQPHYNLVARRDYEGELQALAVDNGLGVFPYFSLAAGFLTGKYRTREDLAGTQRERLTTGYFSDAGLAVVQGLQEIADSRSAELSSVALAWLLARPGITAPIASASSLAQVPALLDAPTLRLTSHEVDTLTGLSDAVA